MQAVAGLSPAMDDALSSHQLALLFMVLAIGSLMDITRPAYNIDAERYHQLARAALFQSAIFEEPTISAVQALVSSPVFPFPPVPLFPFASFFPFMFNSIHFIIFVSIMTAPCFLFRSSLPFLHHSPSSTRFTVID